MMICKADFEELFPDLFQPNESCIARWEDDGGRTAQGDNVAQSGQAAPAFVTMPAAAAYGAAWIMLTAYDRMLRGHPFLAINGRR